MQQSSPMHLYRILLMLNILPTHVTKHNHKSYLRNLDPTTTIKMAGYLYMKKDRKYTFNASMYLHLITHYLSSILFNTTDAVSDPKMTSNGHCGHKTRSRVPLFKLHVHAACVTVHIPRTRRQMSRFRHQTFEVLWPRFCSALP